jgi:hypothetical protein
MLIKIKKFARLVFDALIVFVCLIGAAEIRSLACADLDEISARNAQRKSVTFAKELNCCPDDSVTKSPKSVALKRFDLLGKRIDKIEQTITAITTIPHKQENDEQYDYYNNVYNEEENKRTENLEKLYHPKPALLNVPKNWIDFEISFLKARKRIPDQFTSESYFLLAGACYYIAAASLAYGVRYNDQHFIELGTLMLIGNMVLWATPRAAFYCRDQFAWVKRH